MKALLQKHTSGISLVPVMALSNSLALLSALRRNYAYLPAGFHILKGFLSAHRWRVEQHSIVARDTRISIGKQNNHD
jgi:hypothetical protein